MSNITALKLCCKAFYIRLNRAGLNAWDEEAYNAAVSAVKEATGEIYASGEWWKNTYAKGENV